MKICPKCGHKDPDEWRHSRFDYNADYCRFDDAPKEVADVVEALKNAKTFEPFEKGAYTYYRRGKGGIWLYRVWTPDFKMPRERKKH